MMAWTPKYIVSCTRRQVVGYTLIARMTCIHVKMTMKMCHCYYNDNTKGMTGVMHYRCNEDPFSDGDLTQDTWYFMSSFHSWVTKGDPTKKKVLCALFFLSFVCTCIMTESERSSTVSGEPVSSQNKPETQIETLVPPDGGRGWFPVLGSFLVCEIVHTCKQWITHMITNITGLILHVSYQRDIQTCWIWHLSFFIVLVTITGKEEDKQDHGSSSEAHACIDMNSWGVFLNYYKEHVFLNQMDKLSWVGSLCVALFFILGPINQTVIRIMGYRYMLWTGMVLCTAALILASFAKEVMVTRFGWKGSKVDLYESGVACILNTRIVIWLGRIFCLVPMHWCSSTMVF